MSSQQTQQSQDQGQGQEEQRSTPNNVVKQESAVETSRPTVTSDDNLTCLWGDCGDRLSSPELLFEHICEKHIGRKSTNNLNLTCGWLNCSATTVKRDHITSHVRVHVPLKPHKCEFCGKAFKRPQDLKKHVKTHADDSVLLRAPENGGHGGVYRQGGKLIADLQNLAANPGYDHNGGHMNPSAPYGYTTNGHNRYYAPQPSHTSSYTPVYYPVNHPPNMNHSSYDSRKRGYDALNDFFGDAKRRQIDPTSYTQVGQRLTALQSMGPTHGGSIIDYMLPAPALVPVAGHGSHGPMPQQQYALPPMPNLRTKTDLLNIDQFLEQMQSTVYESSNAAAAAGVQQPGSHYTHQAINFRQSHSPPQTAIQVTSSYSAAPMIASHSSHSSIATPDLTPPSSVMSYQASQSPESSHDMSPASHHSTASYPSLSAVTMSYAPHSTAPTSTLDTNFDSDPRRRYSGGMLKRSAQPRNGDMVLSDDTAPPTPKMATHSAGDAIVKHEIRADNIDPALSDMNSPGVQSENSETARDRAEEAWIENIRVIEALRKLISDQLELKQYDDEDENSMTGIQYNAEKRAAASSGACILPFRLTSDCLI